MKNTELIAVKGSNGYQTRYLLIAKKRRQRYQNHRNMYGWLAMYGILISCIFMTKAAFMYLTHDHTILISPLAHAQTLDIMISSPTPHTPHKTPAPTITPTSIIADPKRQYILSQTHADILLRIWTNESSQGTNRKDDSTNLQTLCEAKGESNEFGYGANIQYCFSSFNYSVDSVNRWFDYCLNGGTKQFPQPETLRQCLNIY